MSEWLGVELWDGRRPVAKRHRVSDFPVLRDQKRSDTGFQHVPGGVLRIGRDTDDVTLCMDVVREPSPDPEVSPPQHDLTAIDFPNLLPKRNRPQEMLDLLRELAGRGEVLPRMGILGMLLDLKCPRHAMTSVCLHALRSLVRTDSIVMWEGDKLPGFVERPRAVRLRDGRVLRNDLAPSDVQP